MDPKVVLSLENITKKYPGVLALNNVSMSFLEGEVHALLGENGAGKSTLIKAVAGAIDIDSGIIKINGNRTIEEVHNELKQKIDQFLKVQFNRAK